MAKELFSNILSRLPSALAIAVVVFGVLYFQNFLIITLLIFLVTGLLFYEWFKLSSSKINFKHIIFLITPFILFISLGETFVHYFLLATLGFWSYYGFLLVTNNTDRAKFVSFNNNYLGIFLIQAFLFGLLVILLFLDLNISNYLVLFLLLFITALIDVAAYLVGSSIGRTPLFKDLSPNKTLEGFIGSVLLTVLFIFLIHWTDLVPWILLLILMLVIPFAFIGDYFESQLKRKQQIKDSGSIIPGHGGIWDRLDSHIAIIPIFAALSYWLV